MKHLKLFFALFAMLALGVGNAWGAEASITFKDEGLSNGVQYTDPFELDANTTITFAGGSNDGKYYTTGYGIRTYGDGTITIACTNGTISEISLTFSGNTYKPSTDVANPTGYSSSTGKWTGNASSVTFTRPSGSGHWRLQSVKVTYETSGSGSTEPVLSVTPTEVDFGTVYQGATVEAKTVAVNFSNLTGAVTYNGLEATPFTATGSISATGDKITIAADASTIDEYSQTLTVVSAADNKTAKVTVTMKVVEAPAPTGTFELYSGELTEGDYVIYYNGSAMKAEVASSRLSYVEVAPTDNKIENPDAATIWHIAQSGTNWTIYNNDKGYAAGTGTANKAQLLSQEDITTSASASDNLKKASWTVTGTETYDFVNVFNSTKDSPVNATLRNNVNGGTNYGFACYATNTGGALTLYKKSDGKQPAGLVYETNKYRTKLGDSFATPTLTNPNSLNVTYSSSNNDVAEVATDGSVTIKAVGGVEITATFAGSETHRQGSAKYTICVTEHAGTQADPYSVADARRVIDVMETAEGVYATGIVSEIVTAYNSTYGNITYNISVDGTTTGNQLQAYRGKSYDGANFKSADDVKVGDEVVIKGTLKKYSTTYEFDENNQLVSLNRTKEQAGLAYEETELTANVGEEFTEPALTNPNNLTVTYSSSNTALATVNATTGEVTIIAAGKVTITASSVADATYAAGSASYTITISNPAMAVATLPFAFNSGKAAIETTAGMTQNGLGSDYGSAPLLKFDGTGDYVIIHFNGEPGKLSYDIKGNSYSDGTFTVQESEDGSAYTNIVEYTELGSTETKTHTLAATSRYVKFIYTEKVNGNVALGNIKIALPEEEPGEGGGETPGERLTEWVLTPLADITTNDLVVITMTKGETTWAMTNDNGTSAAPAAPVVTLSADALAAEPDANLKWVVSNDNGTLTIYPYGTYETYLYCTNTNNGVRVGTGDAEEFTINGNYLYTSQTKDARYIGVYNAQDWRCYTSINSNIEGQTLAFFVKKNANDVLPGTGEEPGDDPVVPTPTINPTATFIFNTAEGLNDLGITYPVTPTTVEDGTEDAFKTEFENNAKFTQDGITMTTTGGTVVATRVWLTAAGKLDLRVYKGATLTFSVPAEHQISTIVFDGSNIGHLLVNGTAVSGNAWTGSAQTITFTAKDDATTIKINTIAFIVEYTRNVTNKYGSICLPYASASTSGAYFYEVVGKGTENSKPAVYLASVNTLKAGVPYIFEKTANTIKVVYSSEKEDDPQNANGLIGNFTNEYVVPANNYILYNNAFIPADGTTNKVNAYRAYLNLSAVEGVKPNQMPGRRYIGMDVQGENVETGVEDLFTTDAPVKVIENGQLIIIRDGVKYNVQGQKL